ncbi:hypothetical protein [Francisella frigiditurris]|uniref:Putative membrane protein n=1 Tax=Francisella frigiditurris TaxID=1542390 RepID=A0A1J0KRX4_9GAMM|nr:hypothetical protein [Francisella frigiditurris]APC96455.1 putative membrane protein [Francisella frigiditurris]
MLSKQNILTNFFLPFLVNIFLTSLYMYLYHGQLMYLNLVESIQKFLPISISIFFVTFITIHTSGNSFLSKKISITQDIFYFKNNLICKNYISFVFSKLLTVNICIYLLTVVFDKSANIVKESFLLNQFLSIVLLSSFFYILLNLLRIIKLLRSVTYEDDSLV